jgi:hypothetical protein
MTKIMEVTAATPNTEHEQFGAESFTDEDRAYTGSRFAEVREAIFANPYRPLWGAPGAAPLPMQAVTLSSVLRGALSFGKNYVFRQATVRTVDSQADLRWGPDRKGYRRILHPNGACLTGRWRITEATPYSGYFRQNSEALVVGRYSTCCTETRRGNTRSLALVGKLFPTTDPMHSEPLRTAGFITQQDIAGENTAAINDAELRNAPDVHAWRRGSGMPILLITGLVFQLVDKEPTQRQLYPIAELGKAPGEPTRCPKYMRLRVVPEQPRIAGDALDFRDEVMAQIFDPGNPRPQRTLGFVIDVSDDGATHGPGVAQHVEITNWQRIGRLIFDDAVVSYNGDHVIHFNHPTWRGDRNDPATATRINGRRQPS